MFEIIMYKKNINKIIALKTSAFFLSLILYSFLMSSIKNNHKIFNKLLEYESIFKHYGVEETQSTYSYSENDDLIRDNENQFGRIRNDLEKNENNKKKISKKSEKQVCLFLKF